MGGVSPSALVEEERVEYQSAIDALLAQARAVLDRVEPGRLDDELAAGAVLIDIRPVEQRQRDAELTGAPCGMEL